VENKERWMELCAQASQEQDPERLFKLVQEINNLLEEKEARLKKSRLTLRVNTVTVKTRRPERRAKTKAEESEATPANQSTQSSPNPTTRAGDGRVVWDI
jgi:hypothetical protein